MTARPISKLTAKQLLDRMNNQSDFPAVSQHITEINIKASPASNSTANELACIILKDYSLTCKLLKVVNSAMYSQFSGKISTISRAVVILGFEQVRLTAIGLIFFAHLQDKSTAQNVKETVLSSFLSGILAQEVSKFLNMKDWEDHFICAMFHNLGRLLVMYYFPDMYEAYQKLVAAGDVTDQMAMQQTLGATFDELGVEVAEAWHLPQLIITGMKMLPEGDNTIKSGTIDAHTGLANFANDLCDITINYSPLVRQEQLRLVLQRYQALYDIPEDEIVEMMESALGQIRGFADVLNLKQTDLCKLDQRSFKAQFDQDSVSVREERGKADDVAQALGRFEITAEAASPCRTGSEDRHLLLQDSIQEISNVMLDDFSVDTVFTMILETIYRGIDFDRVLIFFRNPKTDIMEPRFGLGQNVQELLTKFSFPVQDAADDLVNLALAEGRDFFIDDISASDINPRKPSWFRGLIFSPSFVLYPIMINKRSVGLIYGAFSSPDRHLDRRQLDALKTLRNQAALAIKLSSTG
jgi:HD-like signal output (HDOD) protein